MNGQDFRFYRGQAWSTEQGLPQDTVHGILQTADGFLWLGTEGGLTRYDGASFTNFNHNNESAFHNDDVCCLTQDKTGDLWIGTTDGLVRLHAGRFEVASDGKGLLATPILSIAVTSDDTLVVLTAQGVWERKGGQFSIVLNAPSGVEALEAAGDGSVWLVTSGAVFSLKADRVATIMPFEAGSKPIKGVRTGPNGSVWTYTNSRVHLVQNGWSRDWTVGRDVSGSRVESLFIDRDGLGWLGSNDGVTVLDGRSERVGRVEFLRGETVLQTYQDREGSYWVGTENSGLHLLRGLKFRALMNNVAVRALVEASDHSVWVGTRDDGVRRVDSAEHVTNPVPLNRLTSPVILSLAAGAKGSVWVGTPDGLNRVAPDGEVHRVTSAEGLPDDYIQALAGSPDGSVWIGTRHGLVHLDGSMIDVFTKSNGLGGDLIGTLLLSHAGELWMGTSGGLSRRSVNGKIVSFGMHEGLGRGIVSALSEDSDGSIWIATSGGDLSRFASGVLQPIRGQIFQGQVQGLVADGKGYLWSRESRGIERVAIAELDQCASTNRPCTAHPISYGQADGIPSEEMTTGGSPAISRLADGEIWFVTRRGLAIADPGHMPFNKIPSPVAIESFRVDDVTRTLGGGTDHIASGHTRFTFEYAALTFLVPSAVHYRVKLEGLDSGWSDVGGRRSATYTNLAPRTYRFRVQAENNDGVWNEAGDTLLFQIVPPVYRRWWFLALMLLMSAGLITFLYRFRLRVLQEQFELVLTERNRLAREIHDTLAQDFVGVSLQLDIVSQMLGGKRVDAAMAQVQQTRRLVTEGLAEARQSIWELRANTAQDSLPSRLRRIVKRYSSDGMPVRAKIGGVFRPLNEKLETEVLRIAQEALSNVQRHSGATAASVDLHYGSDMLVLTIEDDGRGFAKEQAADATGHFGLRGMEERAALLAAALDITSTPGEGTTIRLTTKIDSGKSRSRWKNESK